jgi:hypothetical protein
MAKRFEETAKIFPKQSKSGENPFVIRPNFAP